MNTLEIKGDWSIGKGILTNKWATLTSDDLRYVKGEHTEWLGRIERRIGETREAIENTINDVFSSRV